MQIGVLEGTTLKEQTFTGTAIQTVFNQVDIKGFTKVLDAAYADILAGKFEALIMPIQNWQAIKAVTKSKLQLTPVPVLFLIQEIVAADRQDFVSTVNDLDKFRNIRIGLTATKEQWPELTRAAYFTNLATKPELYPAILGILQFKMPVKRRYIGWRHHANELRQKIKFNKDLLQHEARVKAGLSYKETYDAKEPMPKLIHYCWFGKGQIPADLAAYIAAWQKLMPDYTFKCWNESNFPIEKYRFAQEALAKKKWAFLSDVARLHALYYEGGIYLDTDIELLKPLDVFLKEDAFTSYESLNLMATGVMGFKKHHPWLALMLSWYDGVHCDDDYTEIANTKVASKITRLHYGIKLDGREQTLPDGLHIYPRDYFSPEILDHKWQVTENTYCIHHFTGLW